MSTRQKKPEGRPQEIEAAARNLLDTICEMTSEQFSRGEDREARLRLARALGLPVENYGL